ncbi:hypothetical protein IAT38_004937 [Cryptococcus sp. DSM 104549]
MIRQASARLINPTLQSFRPISTTSPALIKIRTSNSKPSKPKPSKATPSSAAAGAAAAPKASPEATPSPAERPPKVPEEVSQSTPFEPEVNSLGSKAGPAPAAEGAPAAGTAPSVNAKDVPLTPPSPSEVGATGATAGETVDAAAGEANATKEDFGSLPSLDIDPEQSLPEPKKETEGEGEGAGKGPRKKTGAGKKEYVSSMEKRRRMWIRIGYGALGLGALGAVATMGSESGAPAEKSVGPIESIKNNVTELLDYFNKPAFSSLLPDPLPPPHQRPYTLLIDLEGLLVHSSWDREHGWRTAKRPGVDYFLGYLSQFYEIVLFTSQPLYTASPVAEKIDPYQAFMPYRLFRESTRYVDGKVVKDISYLNRDPSKVIILDTNPEHVSLQPENGIIIKPWDGKPRDKGLVDMIPFLESIGIFSPADVRPILTAYQNKDIPVEYAKKEAEAKAKAVEEWERAHPNAVAGAGSGFLSSMFGSVAAPGSSRPNQPMTYLEQKRAQAQAIYKEEQKYWAEHADEFKQLIEEDKARQLAEMKGSLLGYLGGPKVPEGPKEKSEEVWGADK